MKGTPPRESAATFRLGKEAACPSATGWRRRDTWHHHCRTVARRQGAKKRDTGELEEPCKKPANA